MKVVVRADASPVIGSGHIFRCLSLADACREKGAEVIFFSKNNKGNKNELLRSREYDVRVVDCAERSSASDDADACQRNIDKNVDWIVIDHYSLGIEWEKQMRPFARNLMVIDDMADRKFDCDVIINQNDNYSMGNYNGLIPSGCRLLLGRDYVLLGSQFRSYRKKTKIRNSGIQKLLVFFGTGDDNGETLKALQGLSRLSEAKDIHVIAGTSNQNIKQIRSICAEHNWQHYEFIDHMAELLLEIDIVIGAAGFHSWERCALALPAIIAVLDSNQNDNAKLLSENGAAIYLGNSSNTRHDDYFRAIKHISDSMLTNMSKKAFAMVDANGARRVCEIMSEYHVN